MESIGGFVDDDDEVEVRRAYSELGYELLFPGEVRAFGGEESKRVTTDVTEIFDKVYRRSPDLSTEQTRQLTENVISGRVLLFALRDHHRSVVATAAFTKVEPIFPESRLTSYEAGRTAKTPGSPPRLAVNLLRARHAWAGRNPGGADYLLAHARVARAQADRPHNGGVLALGRARLHSHPRRLLCACRILHPLR
jgi:hypothetical protein